MINIKDYPKMVKEYNVYKKLVKKGYKEEIKGHEIAVAERKGALKDIDGYERNSLSYTNDAILYGNATLAKTIYETFYPLNPSMRNVQTGKIETFVKVFGNKFENINENYRGILVGLIDGCALYHLNEDLDNGEFIILKNGDEDHGDHIIKNNGDIILKQRQRNGGNRNFN